MSLLKFFINSNKKRFLNASSKSINKNNKNNTLVSKLLFTTSHNQSTDDKNINFVDDIKNDTSISTESTSMLLNLKNSSLTTHNLSSSNCSKYQVFIKKNKSFINKNLMQFRNELLLAEIKEESHEYTDDDGKKITTKLDYIALQNSQWTTFNSPTLFIRSFYNKYFTERLKSFKLTNITRYEYHDCFLLLGTKGIGILFIFYQLYYSEVCLW